MLSFLFGTANSTYPFNHTTEMGKVLRFAQEVALGADAARISTVHLLHALSTVEGSESFAILEKSGFRDELVKRLQELGSTQLDSFRENWETRPLEIGLNREAEYAVVPLSTGQYIVRDSEKYPMILLSSQHVLWHLWQDRNCAAGKILHAIAASLNGDPFSASTENIQKWKLAYRDEWSYTATEKEISVASEKLARAVGSTLQAVTGHLLGLADLASTIYQLTLTFAWGRNR